jgi:N-acetylglucosamine malate deacetylase 1
VDKTVLALLAHPDDAEFLCAGTLIRLSRECGYRVHIATMTAGDCGSVEYPPDEIGRIRKAEGADAAKLMGAEYHCVGEKDLRVFFNNESLERVVSLIVQVQPSIVITHSPDDYHLDHEMTSTIVRAATFAAPIPNFMHGRWPHPPLDHIPHLFYCDPLEGKNLFGVQVEPNFRIDITSHIDLKSEMLAAHASQRNWLLKHHGVDNYLIAMREWSKIQGERMCVGYAEGFRQHLGHSYPQNPVLKELLAGTPK